MTRKHKKYTPEWLGDTKKLITKTEKVKDKDGNETDKSIIEKLVNEYKEFEVEKTRLESVKQQAEEYENKALNEEEKISKILPKWKEFNGIGTAANAFWSDGTTADGWGPRVKAWVEAINGGDNICKGKINKDNLGATADVNLEITEEEGIALWSKAVKAFGGINDTDFDGKKGTGNRGGITPANAKTYLDEIQNQAKNMAKNKSFGRDGWEIGLTYSNYDDNNKKQLDTPLATDRINWSHLVDLAKFIDASDWTDKDLDQTNFASEVSWDIYPKGDQYTAEELKKFVGNISNTPKLYKTGLKKIGGSWVKETPTTVKMKTIRDWAKLVLVLDNNALTKIADGNSSTADTTNQDNIYQKLFRDMRDDNTFTETNGFSIDAIDESRSKIDKKMLIQKASQLSLEYDSKKNEVERKKTDKEAEIKALIKEKTDELRATLTAHKIDKPFEDKSKEADGIDNRKSEVEIRTLLETLKDIRYLEKDDEEASSSEAKENTAYDALKTLYDEYVASKCFGFGLQDGATNTDKCKNIKKKDGDKDAELKRYHDDFESWEKKIKFSDLQKQQLKDIKIALGKSEDPMDKLQTYQDKLKEIDPILTDTVITQAIIDDWKTQNNFKTAETMTAEIKKVLKDKALDDTFKAVMTKADSEITDLAKLLQKKKAKEIITMIRRWEYDKDTDTDKRKKLVWTLELKDPKDDKKYLDDKDLTDKEINDVLYEIAVGTKTLASQKKEDETSEGPGNDNKEMSFWKEWLGFGSTGKSVIGWGLILLAVAGLLSVVFWNNITEWWHGPKSEEDIEKSSEEEEKDE